MTSDYLVFQASAVVADPFGRLSSDRSVYLCFDPVSGLASAADLYSGLDFDLDPADSVGLSTSFERVPGYTVFHDLQDCCAATFCRHPLLLHNLYQLEKALPYYGKCVPISFYPFLFCWQNHIAPWLPETFVVVRAYFPNCTWIQQI